MSVVDVTVTPIAIPDVPLANLKGVHPSVFLRSVIELRRDTGLVGLSETHGPTRTLTRLQKVARGLAGLDPCNLRGTDVGGRSMICRGARCARRSPSAAIFPARSPGRTRPSAPTSWAR